MSRRLPRTLVALAEVLVTDPITRAGLVGDLEERHGKLADAGMLRRTRWIVAEALAVLLHYGWRGERGMGMRDGLGLDLRFALRSLARRPGFAALVVGTLALGIGANTAIFSVVKGLLLEALPYGDSERLVLIGQLNDEGEPVSVAFPNYRDWKERSRSFDRFAAILPGAVALTRDAGSSIVESGWVHGGFFETLGVDAELGRTFTEAETAQGSPPIAVLSHRIWQADFGGDPAVVGSNVVLRGAAFTVIGVMPTDFLFYDDTDVWLPLGYLIPGANWNDRGTGSGAEVVARLRDGVTLDQARADLAAVVGDLRVEFGPEAYDANPVLLRDWYLGDTGRQALLLMAAVGLVLLVACANVANLLFVRSETRRGEIAVRSALGAGRGRVLRQLLTESAVFGLAGGVLGALIGWAGLGTLLGAIGHTLPAGATDRIDVDAGVLILTGAAALATAFLAGTLPAVRGSATGLADVLRESGSRTRRGSGVRRFLIGAEVAFSMILLVSAGLVIASLRNLQHIDKGFDARGIVTLRMPVTTQKYDSRELWAGFHREVREGIAALPGVTSVATSNHFPLSGNSWEMLYRDELTPAGERGSSVLLTMVSPDYFATYGVEILEGRGFTDADRWGGENVAIVDESLARSRWPGESAIGKSITFENLPNEEGEYVVPVWRRVIGVARHVRHYELGSPSRIEVYTPIAQSAAWGFTSYVSVRASSAGAAALVPAIRRVVADLDPQIPLYRIRTMEAVLDRELGAHRAVRSLLGVFAGLTLLLGAVGIYSVVSHTTARRVREVGVRMALGGPPRRIVGLIVSETLGPVLMGLAAGGVAAVAASSMLGSLLFEVRPADPVVLASAGAGLLAVAVVSAWLPARAAAGVHPREALAEE